MIDLLRMRARQQPDSSDSPRASRATAAPPGVRRGCGAPRRLLSGLGAPVRAPPPCREAARTSARQHSQQASAARRPARCRRAPWRAPRRAAREAGVGPTARRCARNAAQQAPRGARITAPCPPALGYGTTCRAPSAAWRRLSRLAARGGGGGAFCLMTPSHAPRTRRAAPRRGSEDSPVQRLQKHVGSLHSLVRQARQARSRGPARRTLPLRNSNPPLSGHMAAPRTATAAGGRRDKF